MTNSSCEKYLDKAPESTFTESEVFSNYDNFKKFFDFIYYGSTIQGTSNRVEKNNIATTFNLYIAGWPRKWSFEQLTELADLGRIRDNHSIKAGTMGSNIDLFVNANSSDGRPVLPWAFKTIRICNIALEKIKIQSWQGVAHEDIDDLTAQAYFIRAYAHFCLFRLWGPMPYIKKVIGGYDQWDIPRLTKHETLMNMAADLDTAIIYYKKANRMRRDNPIVGAPGHLNHPDMFRPNGVAAMALKGRILLYAASPLNNELGVSEWQDAAVANWEAIQSALQNGYALLTKDNYKLNYVGNNYTNEQLWGYTEGPQGYGKEELGFLINGVFSNSKGGNCGCSPTQNLIDRFETQWGDPLNTSDDRNAATALGHYNEQDPYTNRDPRFYVDIIYNQAPIPAYNTAQIWFEMVGGKTVYSQLLNPDYQGITHTGYYNNKLWGGQSVLNNTAPIHTDPIIRLAELYLNYAEAANEAYGPNTPAPGATLTAVQAINIVRQRVGQADVLSKFTTNKDEFRPRIKNERIVELVFEGHHYFDSRRWKDAPTWMAGPLMGMNIEKVPISATYPIGFKHTRKELEANRQSKWKDEMYYFPFATADYNKMRNFDCSLNPTW